MIIEKLTRHAIKNGRIVIMFLILIFFFGLMAYQNLPRAEDPGFIVRKAQINTFFPGASPERIERLVTDPIEEGIQEMPEIEFITSESRTGVSVITVKVQERYKNLRPIWDTLRRKVERASRSLPTGVIGPFVNDEFGDVFGTILTVSGDGFSYKELQDTADEIREELLFLKEVAKVEVYGSQEERIFIEYEDATLADLGGSTLQLKNLLNSRNILIPGGVVYTEQEQIILEPSGNYESLEELQNTVLSVPNTSEVLYMKDFSKIYRGYTDPPLQKMTFMGKPCIGLAISLREGGNIIELGKEVQTLLKKLRKKYPLGLDLSLLSFEPGEVARKVDNFISNLMQSVTIVMIVMLVSLGMRSGLVVASLLPTAILMTFSGMAFFSIGIDQTSLAALIISLGMLVDNAIVISESIMTEMRSGKNKLEAALHSTKELYIPLLTSSLTTSCAFLPIFLAKSTSGEYTASLFKVVTISLLSSWLLSLTLIPFLCVTFLKIKKEKTNHFQTPFYTWYRNTLTRFLHHPYKTMTGFATAFLIALLVFQLIPKSFFPLSDRTLFTIDIELPVGTKFSYTEEQVFQIESFINQTLLVDPKNNSEGIISYSTFIGGWAPRYILNHNPEPPKPARAFFLINTTSHQIIETLAHDIETFIKSNLPQVRIISKKLEYGPPVDSPIAIRISGDDKNELYRISDEIKSHLIHIDGVKNIRDDWGDQSKKILVKVNQPRALRANITNMDVAISLQTKLSGYETAQYRHSEDMIPITLRSAITDRQNLNKLETLRINSQNTTASVPLKQIADINLTFQPNEILRRNRIKTMTIMTDLKPGFTHHTVMQELAPWLQSQSSAWPEGYTYEYGGKFESSNKATKSIRDQLPIAALLILLLLVMQFNSFRAALIVVLTIPLGIIGVALGLLLTGEHFGFMTLLGVVSLSGIVVNNAIVLLDRIRILQVESKLSPHQAILNAAVRRLRPILLTTVTTVVGLLPLWMSGGPLFRPMAATIIFGLFFATFLTLIFVPTLYSLLYRASFKPIHPYTTHSKEKIHEPKKEKAPMARQKSTQKILSHTSPD